MNKNLNYIELRKKYYFIDYTDKIKVAKRVHKIINNRFKKNIFNITIRELIVSLNWGLDITYNSKKRKTKHNLESRFLQIKLSLFILEDAKLLDYNIDSDIELVTDIALLSVDSIHNFDNKIKDSSFLPIKGTKQILTDEMKKRYKYELNINYQSIIDENKDLDYNTSILKILKLLENTWCESYFKMINKDVELTVVPDEIANSDVFDYYSLYDDSPSHNHNIEILSEDFYEDRTVVVYGFANNITKSRVKNDIDMRYANSRNWTDKETDLGHFFPHASGGNIWTNIFPQKREINRGQSKRGKVYRKMEKYIKQNEGIFYFSRPIYFDFSIRPYIIENGYITKNFNLVIEYFENV